MISRLITTCSKSQLITTDSKSLLILWPNFVCYINVHLPMRPDTIPWEIQRSPVLLLSSRKTAMLSYSKYRPQLNWKTKRHQTATTNSVKIGSPSKKWLNYNLCGATEKILIDGEKSGIPAPFLAVVRDNENGSKANRKVRAELSLETERCCC